MYQTKRRKKATFRLEMLAVVSLTLGISSWALGQDCGVGDFVSAEACLVDGDTDTVNGGCNSNPNLPFPFEAGVIGQSISGTVSTYLGWPACPADFTVDHTVNTSDLLNLFANWGPCDNPANCPADLTGDGTVNTSDLLNLFANWGPCPPPTTPTRDTDWYLVSQNDLMAADTDGNGVIVVSHTGTSEVPVVLFIVSIGAPNTCDAITVIGTTGFAGDAANTHCIGGNPSSALINIADHPNGIVFYVAPGTPTGASITTGYPCSNPPHDYNVTLSVSELHVACTFDGEPCNVPTPGIPGCNDPVCCDLVCSDFDVACCDTQWDAFCVEFATNEDFAGCAPGLGAPAFIATGPDNSVDGYLDLFADGFGSQSQPFGTGPNWLDNYNPVGGALQNPGFTTTTFLFTGGTNRIVLSLHADVLNVGWPGSTMAATFLEPGVVTDELGGDGVMDTVVNHFSVNGALTLDVISTQSVETSLTEGGVPYATWRLSYEIRNDGAAATFDIVRWNDADLLWQGIAGDDLVGTGTNAGAGCDTYAYITETGAPNFGITLSTDAPGANYIGSKLLWDVDCAGPITRFGFGTDPNQYWASFGIEPGWLNLVAGVGYDTDGDSGQGPDDGCNGPSTDGSIGLTASITLGAGETTIVTFVQTYGAITPNGAICSK